MSTYLEDAQGKIVSNPINETNTKYAYTPKNEDNVKDANDHPIDYQYMYNDDEPISNIDTDVFSSYRNKTEELRTKTESYYEALESCLVPAEIPGMAFQPWEYRKDKDEDGNDILTKIKSLQYFFQDHPSNIGSDAKEFVFRTNKVKFVDDRHRRLIYDRKIHIMALQEDEDNKVSFKDVLLRTFFTYYNNQYWCNVRNLNGVQYTINNLMSSIITANTKTKDNEKLVVLVENEETGDMEEKVVESVLDFDYVMQSGQDINTTIPSTVYNLYNIGWIHASMIFLNGLAIQWTKAIISVDNIDTFVIVSGLDEPLSSYIDNEKEITMEYIHIPFKCIYTVGIENASNMNCPYREFLNSTKTKFDTVPFMFDRRYGAILQVSDYYKSATSHNTYYDRVICVDPNIKFAEFYLNEGNIKSNEFYLPDIGIQYNQDFRDFCNNDYRCKLKQFNFIGFELNKDINEEFGANSLLTLKNDDFKVTWHPFNILDIRFKRLYNNRRLFKVFYNTKVLYDQDNILRIKNHDKLADEYEKYRQDVTANIETYLNEVYLLAKKDIGTYINMNKKTYTYGYKYHYVTPYECFLLFNAIHGLLGRQTVSFDEFRKLNVINYEIHKKSSDDGGGGGGGGGGTGDGFDYIYPEYIYDEPDDDDYPDDTPSSDTDDDDEPKIDTEHYVGYMRGGFVVYDDDHNFFSEMVKEKTLFDNEGNLNADIRAFWETIIALDSVAYLTDFLIPIDDVRNKEDDEPVSSNLFYMYNRDNKGKIEPYSKYMTGYSFVQEYDDVSYDFLKLRFEMSYLNNMEEGATPVDEFIYYFDNDNFLKANAAPVVSSYDKRYTANLLNALAYNVFKSDPHLVLESILKLNYSADYILPKSLPVNTSRDNIITSSESNSIYSDYHKDPRYFYNFGYYDNATPHKLVSEWGLRRNLPEMFYWALEEDEYTIDSMHLLDEVFDFTYGFDKSYEENLFGQGDKTKGMNYIIGYDADKIEATIKRGITSFSRTGKEIKDYINSHPTELYTSIDSYKMFTFVTNNNYIVTTSLERLYATINRNGSVSFSYVDGDGIYHENVTTDIELRYRGQVNPTIKINTTDCTITDIDKGFTVTYVANKTVYNNDTELLEFYDDNNNLLVTMQVDRISSYTKLSMSRWNISKQDNYVMIFKNRVLYDKYYTIHYTDISFDVDMNESDVTDDDVFEFVFFLNANNRIIEKKCTSASDVSLTVPSAYISKSSNGIRKDTNNDDMDKGLYQTLTSDYTFDKPTIACDTSLFDAENIQLLVNKMPSHNDDTYSTSDNKVTTYELNHDVYYYRATIDNGTSVNYQRFVYNIVKDTKVNGLYRLTKQGGGEYFLTFDGTVPEKTDTITTDTSDPKFVDYGYSTDRTLTLPYTIYLSSKRQFRYQHHVISENHDSAYLMTLNSDFKFCTKNSHVLLFKNGLLLPPTYYYLHSIINTPINHVGIIFNIPLVKDDVIDVFYVTNDLHHLECDYYDVVNQERYISNGDIRLNSHDNEYRVMGEDKTQVDYPEKTEHPDWRTNYIKMRSPLYAISSKHSTFVFLNGKKVMMSELEDISDTIMSINTDYARNGDDMAAVRLEVINHLDVQDIIEQMYINDGLMHSKSDCNLQFGSTNKPESYKDTLQINQFSLTDLESYAERTLLDEILNDLSDENLNKLFYNYDNATGPMTQEGELEEPDFIKPDEIIDEIIDEYYYEDDGDKFIWHTMHDEDNGFSNTVFYIGEKDSVRVPVIWDEENVKALYGTTFNRNDIIKKIIIPEGVERIE